MEGNASGTPEQGPSQPHRRGSSGAETKPSLNRAIFPPATMREREQSVGAWSISSVGTGDSRSGASPSVTRSGSRRANKGMGARFGQSSGRGADGKRKVDRHLLALKSIREFLRGRNCYDCLPVSFRLVVLDTKLIVKPALDIMWQAGIVSAPLWQSTTDPFPTDSDDSPNDTTAVHSPGEGSARPVEPSPASLSQSETRTDGGSYVTSPTSYPSSSLTSAMLSSTSPSSHNNADGNLDRIVTRETPLPPGKTGFAGMLTVNDIIHLIQYYYKNASHGEAGQMVEKFRLGRLRDIENTLHVPPPPLLSIDPMRPIFDACQLLLKTHARRLPLLDHDDHTGMDVVVSVLTQYRVLKFIAMNCRETAALHRSIRSLGIGTYVASIANHTGRSMTNSSAISSSRRSSAAAVHSTEEAATDAGVSTAAAAQMSTGGLEEETGPKERRGSGLESLYPLATATLDTTVFDVIHVFSELGISGVPVIDEDGYAVDMYETIDVIDLMRTNAYQSFDLTIREALSKRSKDFSGVMTCSPEDSLATIFALLRTRRVHRMLILEPESNSAALGKARGVETHKDVSDAAIASDTGAVGDGAQAYDENARKTQQQSAREQEVNTSMLGEIPHRKRGRLVGILCLSDIMRYLIASPGAQAAEKAGRLHASARTGSGLAGVTSFSTASSSLEASEPAHLAPRSRQASTEGARSIGEEGGIQAGNAQSDGVTGAGAVDMADVTTLADAAARFDPKDVPPTIEEHPTAEAASPLSHPIEDQTPTRELP